MLVEEETVMPSTDRAEMRLASTNHQPTTSSRYPSATRRLPEILVLRFQVVTVVRLILESTLIKSKQFPDTRSLTLSILCWDINSLARGLKRTRLIYVIYPASLDSTKTSIPPRMQQLGSHSKTNRLHCGNQVGNLEFH